MTRTMKVVALVVFQALLVGVGVAPQVSARLTGETYLLRVEPIDPIDPFRGAYVTLDYPDLQPPEDVRDQAEYDGDGTMFAVLEKDGEVMVASEFTRSRPDSGPYIACAGSLWNVNCGIESLFLPQDKAREMEELLLDGAIAEVKIDGRGHAALIDVRAP